MPVSCVHKSTQFLSELRLDFLRLPLITVTLIVEQQAILFPVKSLKIYQHHMELLEEVTRLQTKGWSFTLLS